MPKQQFLDPVETRKSQMLEINPIPVNVYNKSMEEEKENFSKSDFVRIFRDMVLIREFETMLNLIKTTGEYQGIPYNHPGPAHLSIGQEDSRPSINWMRRNSWR